MNIVKNFFSERVKSYALSNWRLYKYKDEWLTVILLILVLKLATSAVSIFSGFYFLQDLFFGLLGSASASKIFAVVALVLIELLNALFLAKCFKFLLRFNNVKWIFPAVCSVGFFALSFVISCKGIAIYTRDTVDISQTIKSKYNTERVNVKNEFEANEHRTQQQIHTINANPSEWKDGRRCVLSSAQLLEINACYDHIANLQKERDATLKDIDARERQELGQNETTKDGEADRFYKYVAAIMFIQLACSGGLAFFWCKISGEEDEDTNKKEAIDRSITQISAVVDGCINSRIAHKINIYQSAFNALEYDAPRLTVAAAAPETPAATAASIEPEAPKKVKPIIKGFQISQDSDPLTPQPQPEITPAMPAAETVVKTPEIYGCTAGVHAVNLPNVEPVKITENQEVNASAAVNGKCQRCGKALTLSQITRHAKWCSVNCKVAASNERRGVNLRVPENKLK